MREHDQRPEINAEDLLFEGSLETVISTYKGVEDSPTTGQLLVPQEHMATLLKGLDKQANRIEALETQDISQRELLAELEKAQRVIIGYEQREADDRTRLIEIGRMASKIVATTKDPHNQKPE